MDNNNGTMEVAKFFGGIISTAVTVILYFGEKQKKARKAQDEKIEALEERLFAQEKNIAAEIARIEKERAADKAAIAENVQRLREKVDSERQDFKDRLKEMTDYMYSRPR